MVTSLMCAIFTVLIYLTRLSSSLKPRWSVNEHLQVDDEDFKHYFFEYVNSITLHCVSRGEITSVNETNSALLFLGFLPSWRIFQKQMVFFSDTRFVFTCESRHSSQTTGKSHSWRGVLAEDAKSYDLEFNMTVVGRSEITYAIKQMIGDLPFTAVLNGPGANVGHSAVHSLRSQTLGMVYANMPLGNYHLSRHFIDKSMRDNEKVFLAYAYKFLEIVDPLDVCVNTFTLGLFVDKNKAKKDEELMELVRAGCEEYTRHPFPNLIHALVGAKIHHGFHWGNYVNNMFPEYEKPILFLVGENNYQFSPDIYDGSWQCDFDEKQHCERIDHEHGSGGTIFDLLPGVQFEVIKDSGMWSPLEQSSDFTGKVSRFLEYVEGRENEYVAGEDWAVCMHNDHYYEVGGYWCEGMEKQCFCVGHMKVECVWGSYEHIMHCVGNEKRVEKTTKMAESQRDADSRKSYNAMVENMEMIYDYGPNPRFKTEAAQYLFERKWKTGFSQEDFDILYENKIPQDVKVVNRFKLRVALKQFAGVIVSVVVAVVCVGVLSCVLVAVVVVLVVWKKRSKKEKTVAPVMEEAKSIEIEE